MRKSLTPKDALKITASKLFSRCIIRLNPNGSWEGHLDVYIEYGAGILVSELFYGPEEAGLFALKALSHAKAEDRIASLFSLNPEILASNTEQLSAEYDMATGVMRKTPEVAWRVFQGWISFRERLSNFLNRMNREDYGHQSVEVLLHRTKAKVLELNQHCLRAEEVERAMGAMLR